jgi:hypothetical protein
VKIDQIVSNPQVFNYYYMTPNYNLKLSNQDPTAVIEIPSHVPNSGKNSHVVQNLLSSSQGVLKLCENEQSIKFPNKKKSKRIKTKKTLSNTKKMDLQILKQTMIDSKKSLNQSEGKRSEKEGPHKTHTLKIKTTLPKDNEVVVQSNPMTPSFFKKKTFCEVDSKNLLSREPSQVNNSNHPQKITFGILPYSHDKGMTDFESSMSIPLSNSNLLMHAPSDLNGRVHLNQESPHFSKKFFEPKNVLYSSMAFSMSSSLETSTKFSKLLKNEKRNKKKKTNDAVNKSTNLMERHKKQIKLLKSKRKMQIKQLKEKTDFKEMKKKYTHAKTKQSRKFSKNDKIFNYLNTQNKRQGKDNLSSVKRIKDPLVQASKEGREKESEDELASNNQEFSRRIITSMRKTTDGALCQVKSPVQPEKPQMSVHTSKIHPFVYDNLINLEEANQNLEKLGSKVHPLKSPNLNIFKQRMSSNVELGRARALLEEQEGRGVLNRRVPSEDCKEESGAKGEKRKQLMQKKKYSWRDTPTSTLRKNTSLDLVLKKKSLKFMDMEKNLLKNINKKMRNIYRLSSPSLKNIEDSIINTDSITFKTRNIPKMGFRKNYSKKPSKKTSKRVLGKKGDIKNNVGSVDFDDLKSNEKSSVFESSMKIFRGTLY